MTSGTGNKRKSYSILYKIYRRIRYVRYLKRRRKELLRIKKLNEKQESLELRETERERLRQERIISRQKRKQIKNEKKQEIKQIKKEIEDNKPIVSERKRKEEEERRKLREKEKLEEQKQKLREKRKRKIRFRKGIKRTIRSFRWNNIKESYKNFRSKKHIRQEFYIITANSTILFLLSYLFMYLIYQVTSIVAASFFEYPVIWYFWEVYYNISTDDWHFESVKIIYSSGPIITLFIGLIFLIIYFRLRELDGRSKLFFLWGFLHSVSMFFGAMLVGTLFTTGIGHAITWMYIMDTGKLLYSILSLFFLVMAGAFVTKSFLISANSYYNHITRVNRARFMFAQVFLPYILGTLIMLIIRYPHYMHYESFMMISMIISILPIFLFFRAYQDLYFEEEKISIDFYWTALIILSAFIFFYRVVLGYGLRLDFLVQ